MQNNMQKKDRMSFMLYKDIKPLIDGMTDLQAGILLKSIYNYTCDNKELTCDDSMVSSIFSFVKDKLNYSEEQYDKKCEQNRANALKRWDKNASKGMQDNATACDGIIRNATECEAMLTDTKTDTYTKTYTKTKTDIKVSKDLDKPKSKNKGERFDFKKHVSDIWLSEAKRVRPDFTDQDIKEHMESFTDYWIALPGARGVKLDWLATWRGWLRRSNSKTKQNKQSINSDF